MGGKGPEIPDPYRDPNLEQYQDAALSGVMNRAGAGGNVSGGGAYNYDGSGGGSSGGYIMPSGSSVSARPHLGSAGIGTNAPLRLGTSGNQNMYDGFNKNALFLQGGGGGMLGRGGGASPQKQTPQFNFGNIGAPLGGSKGIKTATSGYDLSPLDEAISGFRNPGKLKETYRASSYNPYQFNYGSLPDEYTKLAYTSGASDINRAGQDSLTKLRESIGTRRPGLLLKAGEDVSRGTNSDLAKLNTNLQLERMKQNLDLARQQQTAQAAENYLGTKFGAEEQHKGYESRSALEKGNLDQVFRYLQALGGAGKDKIGVQSGLLEKERDYQDRALDNIMKMYGYASGQANAAAGAGGGGADPLSGLLGLGSAGIGLAGLLGGGAAAASPFAGAAALAALT